ncbi:MAG: hypothetical protein IPO92_03610 [Saprospiraceae bacterium]|nr:hypothetical protein [Saprospiraceae bacterium]
MKSFLLIIILISLGSCVSSKKHNQLFLTMESLQKEYNKTQDDLADCNEDKSELKNKVEKLNLEKDHLKKRVDDLENGFQFAKKNNDNLTERISDLSGSTKVNADIMKRTLEELELQNQKVLGLSLAMEKKDSLNILLVKKAKKKMSDKKLKKSLEKLGFVFY